MRGRIHLVWAVLALLAVSCQEPDPARSDAGGEEALRATRERVVAELGTLVPALESGLVATLRFSQGNYDGCAHTLEDTTGLRYHINGRLDLLEGEATGQAAARALDAAGWTVEATVDERVTASKDGLDLSLRSLAGSLGEQAFLFTGGDDTCHVVGKERAANYTTDQQPLGAR